ncbi:Ubiquinone biosynthesis protein COQ9, mitochondrial [Schistosoma japonicum]|nr:Ubiquinone biosynthesis protein COQ9, mitochondrial [Schistosoma japonicum]
MIQRLILSGVRQIKSSVPVFFVNGSSKCRRFAINHLPSHELCHLSSITFNDHNAFDGSETPSLVLDSKFKARILESTLAYVQKYGWSREAIEACCQSEGLPLGIHGYVAPQGGIDIVLHFYASCNQQLAEVMQQWKASDSTIRDTEFNEPKSTLSLFPSTADEVDKFLYRALEHRLKMIVPYLDVWPQALGLLSLPKNIPSSLGMLAQLVDEIWAQAGDRSTDMSWYAKRLGIAYVYNLTELYMLQDKSPELSESWIFLRKRIEDLRSMKQMNLTAASSMLKNGVLAFGNVCNQNFRGKFVLFTIFLYYALSY